MDDQNSLGVEDPGLATDDIDIARVIALAIGAQRKEIPIQRPRSLCTILTEGGSLCYIYIYNLPTIMVAR